MGSVVELRWQRVEITELKGKSITFTHSEQQRGNRLKQNEQNLRENNQKANICTVRILEGEENRVRLKENLRK